MPKEKSTYDPNVVRNYYDNFGIDRWERTFSSARARLIHHLHMRFLSKHIGQGKIVLQAGCGVGRFSVPIAEAGSLVTLVDISRKQLEIAKSKIRERRLLDCVLDFVVADICDLSHFDDNTFDTTVCFGGVLNCVCDKYTNAIKELIRVTKVGGTVMFSVNSRRRTQRSTTVKGSMNTEAPLDKFNHLNIFYANEKFNSRPHLGISQPPLLFFGSKELKMILSNMGIENIQLACAPSITSQFLVRQDANIRNSYVWKLILKLEETTFQMPALLDIGEFILAKGQVKR
jgi:ubiquinone/menaquinone biosynthesis C-methylase UbiE